MKRKTKNIIMIILIILTITSMGFTMYYAKNHITTSSSGEMMPPSEMGKEMGNPSDKPNGDNTNSENTPPDANSSETNTPPEKPSGDNNSENESPQMPNDNGKAPEMGNMPDGNTTSSISTGYYIAFAIEGLILSALVIYLIMSNCNKKTMKETFANKDKIVISILSVIILTSLTTLGNSVITNNVILNNNEDINNSNNSNSSNTNGASYSSKTSITEDSTITNKEYSSSTAEENALSVSKAKVTLNNITVTKTGDSTSGDNSNFYGTNSVIIAKDGATLTIKNSNITTDATGANGVFSYGGSATTNNSSSDGTTINISDTKFNY